MYRASILDLLLLCVALGTCVMSVPVELKIEVDDTRPLSLYKGPQTYRRDSRGRPFSSLIITSRPGGFDRALKTNDDASSSTTSAPSVVSTSTAATRSASSFSKNLRFDLKPILVTSKPFGFGKPEDNYVHTPSTTAATTTTSSPLDVKVAPPTIPFFSISCSIGSSCSQIVQARPTHTPRPTFKPYTKEEISKGQLLSTLFAPSALSLMSLQQSKKEFTGGALSTTEKAPVGAVTAGLLENKDALTTTTTAAQATARTTTTVRPATSSLWRIRTKSPLATDPSKTGSMHKFAPSNTTRHTDQAHRWKWPSETHERVAEAVVEDRHHVNRESAGAPHLASQMVSQQTAPSYDSSFRKNSSLAVKPDSVSGNRPLYSTPGRPLGNHNNGWASVMSASLNALKQRLPQNGNPLPKRPQEYRQPDGQTPANTLNSNRVVNRPEKPHYVPSSNIEYGGWKTGGESNDLTNGFTATDHVVSPTNQHDVVTKKGNKVTLITGSSSLRHTPQKQHQSVYPLLPPEVSVSSHVIGLQIKPKSLERPFVEDVQGVSIETDGEDINLSDLIMRGPLPFRPARSHWQPERGHVSGSQRARGDGHYRPLPQISRVTSEWRPIYFPFN